VSVVVSPPGAEKALPANRVGVQEFLVTTPNGATVHVISTPDQGALHGPFFDRVDIIAAKLAIRYEPR
jgi:hypothetical protein